jgi:5'-nucleotidase
MRKPLIFITNDDGYQAPGIEALAASMSKLGRILVVAPSGPQSAVSQTITLHKPVRLWRVREDWIACSGTPTDCVYLGIHALCRDEKPDVVVSGINRGPNLGNDVFYSGTVAGAMEGRLLGYPALAISQDMTVREELSAGGPDEPVNYAPAAELAVELVAHILHHDMPTDLLYNLNVPPHYERSRGLKLVRLGKRLYGEGYSRRDDPRGKAYYWIGGSDVSFEPIPETDCNELHNGYATLTPVRSDLTHEAGLDELRRVGLPGLQPDEGE